ncbi:class III signal peptide-containing protein [Methanothermococcus sp. SCGC AD-155-M21]|nr:class III signal peptide-containing protein [Methanothermococcus sp. SCGC AD-155-M21]
MKKIIIKLISQRGQLSMEFSILMMAVVVAASIVGYNMIKSAIEVKNTSMETINGTSNTIMEELSVVK